MFAYVRFRDDNKKVVLPVSDIKSFDPKGVDDYEKSKWYDVFWDDEKHSGYYLAQIVKLLGKSSLEASLHAQLYRTIMPISEIVLKLF